MPKSAENAHPLRGQATPLAPDIENHLALRYGFTAAGVATANDESVKQRTLVSEPARQTAFWAAYLDQSEPAKAPLGVDKSCGGRGDHKDPLSHFEASHSLPSAPLGASPD